MHLRQRRVGPRGADTAGRRDDAAGAVRAEARVAEQQTVFATATRRPGRARALALAFAFAFALPLAALLEPLREALAAPLAPLGNARVVVLRTCIAKLGNIRQNQNCQNALSKI